MEDYLKELYLSNVMHASMEFDVPNIFFYFLNVFDIQSKIQVA